MAVAFQDFSWDRMVAAVEAARERVRRTTAALERAGIAYAIAGDNAVAAWVARVDRTAVRNTQDVDILVRRNNFDAVNRALSAVGFHHQEIAGVDCFIDGPDGGPRDAIHLIFANERVRPNHPAPAADVADAVPADDFAVLSLDALIRMKLNSYRDKDRMHLRDLIDVGLIDKSCLPQLQEAHRERLQQILDNPDG